MFDDLVQMIDNYLSHSISQWFTEIPLKRSSICHDFWFHFFMFCICFNFFGTFIHIELLSFHHYFFYPYHKASSMVILIETTSIFK